MSAALGLSSTEGPFWALWGEGCQSTLQGLLGTPGALGLCLQMLLLCLQPLRQLLGLREAAFQRIPLGPAGNQQRARHQATPG